MKKQQTPPKIIQIRTIILGTVCRDKATELEGTITHWLCDMGCRVIYIFQPRGLNENGRPLPYLRLEVERLEVDESNFEEVDIPIGILETQVTDNPSGFTGMATGFVRHINGCFHVVIQPKGILEKTGVPVDKMEFDLRQCSGEMITIMNDEQLAASKKDRPSPIGIAVDDALPSSCLASGFAQ